MFSVGGSDSISSSFPFQNGATLLRFFLVSLFFVLIYAFSDFKELGGQETMSLDLIVLVCHVIKFCK